MYGARAEHDAREHVVVPVQVLRRRVDDDVGAVLERAEVDRRSRTWSRPRARAPAPWRVADRRRSSTRHVGFTGVSTKMARVCLAEPLAPRARLERIDERRPRCRSSGAPSRRAAACRRRSSCWRRGDRRARSRARSAQAVAPMPLREHEPCLRALERGQPPLHELRVGCVAVARIAHAPRRCRFPGCKLTRLVQRERDGVVGHVPASRPPCTSEGREVDGGCCLVGHRRLREAYDEADRARVSRSGLTRVRSPTATRRRRRAAPRRRGGSRIVDATPWRVRAAAARTPRPARRR